MYSREILLNTATIREVNSTEIDSNLGNGEKIRPVGCIVKSWTGHMRMISQSNLRIKESGSLRFL